MNALVKQLQGMTPKFAQVLPPHVSPDRFVRVCLMALNQTPDLLKCDPKSFLESCLTAAQLGLEPDKNLGQAYFVPFYDNKAGIKKVQLIPGYKGYITLARNSGEIQSIAAHEVYSNDEFDYEFGLNERLVHKPAMGERGDLTHFYAVVKFKDGGHSFEVMTKTEVDRIRSLSKNSGTGPWRDHYAEMGKKTVIRRIAKYLPQNVQKAAAVESAYLDGRYASMDDVGNLIVDAEVEEQDVPAITEQSSRLDQLAKSVNKEEVLAK